MTIGQKIKNLRINLDMTQEELAIAANTTKQTIHKYETGIVENIPASKIKAMADKLQTTPAYLMGWEDEKEYKKEDTISDIFIKIRGNEILLNATQMLCELNDEQLKAVIAMLSTFK